VSGDPAAWFTGPPITSSANPRVKALVALRRRRVRDADGVTLVDGYDETVLAIDAGADLRTLYVCPELVTDVSRLSLLERVGRAGHAAFRLSRTAFEKASYRENADGWLAVVGAPGSVLSELRLSPIPLVLVADGVEKPGNLGAMLRTAEALGAEAVIAVDPNTDWGNPNVVRASKATVFAVPVSTADGEEAIGWVRAAGLQIVVGTPDASAAAEQVDLRRASALVVGAEHAGVSAGWRRAADTCVRIPMTGRVNSLNVSISAAILLAEAARQRRTV
jgi:RNA methyltransferase, TrmH family